MVYKYAYIEAVTTERWRKGKAKQKEKAIETEGKVGDKAATLVMGHKMLRIPKGGPHIWLWAFWQPQKEKNVINDPIHSFYMLKEKSVPPNHQNFEY